MSRSDAERVRWARDAFVATARLLDPAAPTLCAGWTARDLLGHLLVLRHDPVAWPGIALPALAGLTARRMAAATAVGYEAALDRLASGSVWLPPVFETPTSRWGHHVGEYIVHTEDLRRANGLPSVEVSGETADALWRRALVAARQLHARASGGIAVTRTDTGETAIVLDRSPLVRVSGLPLELLVWAHRGAAHAQVALS
ncbi:MAG: maleylpyruvate isomerase family mycothiol-dependent enzyme [Arachnia sp.]